MYRRVDVNEIWMLFVERFYNELMIRFPFLKFEKKFLFLNLNWDGIVESRVFSISRIAFFECFIRVIEKLIFIEMAIEAVLFVSTTLIFNYFIEDPVTILPSFSISKRDESFFSYKGLKQNLRPRSRRE